MIWHSFFFFKNEAHDVRDRDYDWDEKLAVHLFYSIGHVLKIKNTYFLLYYIERKVYKDKRPIYVCPEVSDYVSLDMINIIALYNWYEFV